ncbi:hypothetical protein BJ508DRAFT_417484 [Ascobolus immersus RN42]|uniref:BTB domain-containing protein n=1 Tax=Ascobolus immersus RN42 TaxID=1160509 RepID=A0A3N4I4C7_ASCIM|nr:hypothetical protein BJ508DRAFT_417484 [Ascobolus immersus RN42]
MSRKSARIFKAAQGPTLSRNGLSRSTLNALANRDWQEPLERGRPNPQNQAFLDMLNSGENSDLILKCGGREFKVHSFMLVSQSEFFKACLDSGMKESLERTIELVEEDPVDVQRLLEFLYGGTYWEFPENYRRRWKSLKALYECYNKDTGMPVPDEDNPRVPVARSDEVRFNDPLVITTRMYAIADKFGIPALKKQALLRVQEFNETALHPQENSCDTTAVNDSLLFTLLFSPGDTSIHHRRRSAQPVEEKQKSPSALTDVRKRHPGFWKEMAALVRDHWESILDAADSAVCQSVDEDLVDLLLTPIARYSPYITKMSSAFEEDLLSRMQANPELGLRMLRGVCREGEAERERLEKERLS